MRKLLAFAVAVCAIACIFTACKTNEKNYREAYEKAVAKRQAADSAYAFADSTVYTRVRRQAVPSTAVATNGDTLHYAAEWVSTLTEDSLPRETIKPYNVVAGQFKQIFNARSMQRRLREGGAYPGAFIMQTREPLYYVVAGGAFTPDQALQLLHTVQADTAMRLRAPYPRVIVPLGR